MQSLTLTTPITIRQSNDSDATALWRLAQLDSAKPLAGPALIAQYGTEPVAAVALDGTREIADPFVPTEGVLELLRTWVSELRSS